MQASLSHKQALGDILPSGSYLVSESGANALETIFIDHLCIDSRTVKAGGLFCALAGEHFDALAFVDDAVENGASAVVLDGQVAASCIDAIDANIPVIAVPQLKAELSAIAGRFFGNASRYMRVVGVTGTNGKSTIVSLISQLFSLLGTPAGSIGTLGYGLAGNTLTTTGMTTSDAIACQQMLAELKGLNAEAVAMEVSSHGIDQQRVEDITFSAGILTNITRDHLDYHGDFDSYAAVKERFIRSANVEIAIVNVDDTRCHAIAEAMSGEEKENTRSFSLPNDVKNAASKASKSVFTYSVSSETADIFVRNPHYSSLGIQADIITPWGTAPLTTSLIGEFNLANILAVVAAAGIAGVPLSDTLKAVSALESVDGRMQAVTVPSATSSACEQDDIDRAQTTLLPRVFVDYAHTPDALEQALLALRKHTAGRLWLVFGCGGDRDVGKRAQMGAIAERDADEVVLTSDNPRSEAPASILVDIEQGFSNGVPREKMVDREQAIAFAIHSAAAEDTILIAGKGHETYQIIGAKTSDFSDQLVAKKYLLALSRNHAERDPSARGNLQ